MTMIFHFLLFTCACALVATDDVPAYGDIIDSINKAIDILDENVVSMDGNVPDLDDSRRHYAAIVHVVSREAIALCSDVRHDYNKNYQKDINESLRFADEHPQKVIQLTQQVIGDVLRGIIEVKELINASGPVGSPESDKAIHEEIKKDVEKYGKSENILSAAGLAATQLILDDKQYFAQNSQNLSSHDFVITGAEQLRTIVMALKNLYQELYGLSCNPTI